MPRYPIASGPLGPADAHHAAVRFWLIVLVVLVFAMVLVGGATRLTGSGLSITEWRPVTGAIPPLNAADWASEFARYQASPQYKLLNQGMALADFQFIYWWEWGHRQLGRFIGFVHLFGLIAVVALGWVSRRLAVLLFCMGLLLGLQGAVGWIMVASGLEPGMIAVAPVKLTLHLGFACLYLVSLVFVATRLSPGRDTLSPGPRAAALWLLGLIFVQILLGGFVAGSRAGLVYNTWPLMDGALVPAWSKLFVMTPWIENFIDNPTLVQFNHRMMAYLVLAVAVVQAIALKRRCPDAPVARRTMALASVLGAQVLLGIVTLLLAVPLWAGLAHQGLAIVALIKATHNLGRVG